MIAPASNADIWVIYMGNNEVVGPFGAGTVFGQQAPPLPLIRASLALKTTRMGQLIDTLRSEIQKPPPDKSEWGGMEMFLDQQVRADDPRMSAVYDHFARNLSDIIQAGTTQRRGNCRQHGGGELEGFRALCLGASARDCPKRTKANGNSFIKTVSRPKRPAKSKKRRDGIARRRRLMMSLRNFIFVRAVARWRSAKPPRHKNNLSSARDLDTLRFRCDSRLNDLIRQTVSNYGDQRVVLADAEQAFAEQSPDGLPGDDLFYEHVHLTFDGNYLLARTMAPQLESLLPRKITAPVAASQPWPSEADCARRLAWSDWDKQEALSEIFSRLSKPPFTGQLNHDAQVQNLKTALDKLMPATQPAGIKAAESAL